MCCATICISRGRVAWGTWLPQLGCELKSCICHVEFMERRAVPRRYDPDREIESLSGSASIVTIRRRALCGRRGWRAGDVGGVWSRDIPLRGGGKEELIVLLFRVGACADELRLMGVERGSS